MPKTRVGHRVDGGADGRGNSLLVSSRDMTFASFSDIAGNDSLVERLG